VFGHGVLQYSCVCGALLSDARAAGFIQVVLVQCASGRGTNLSHVHLPTAETTYQQEYFLEGGVYRASPHGDTTCRVHCLPCAWAAGLRVPPSCAGCTPLALFMHAGALEALPGDARCGWRPLADVVCAASAVGGPTVRFTGMSFGGAHRKSLSVQIQGSSSQTP